ncbi:MAG: amidohydrolase [Anaerolineae bacterium]|nr:amidohydrolase [Anaerolineae bacterium]
MIGDYFVVNFHEHPGDHLVQKNAEMGIDMSVLLSVGDDALEKSIALSQEKPEMFVPFYWVNPARDLDQEPQRLREAVRKWGIRGIKFQPMDQHWFADDRRLYPIYEVCAELGLVCTWHAGIVKLNFKYELGVPMLARYTDPLPIDQVAFDFPELKICIAHLGGNFNYRAIVLAEKHENVYLDTAFLPFFCSHMLPHISPEELISHAARIAGAEKVLYGSEGLWPQAVLHTELSDREKRLILGENALRLLGLERPSTQ